jgi:hypothetical protein
MLPQTMSGFGPRSLLAFDFLATESDLGSISMLPGKLLNVIPTEEEHEIPQSVDSYEYDHGQELKQLRYVRSGPHGCFVNARTSQCGCSMCW